MPPRWRSTPPLTEGVVRICESRHVEISTRTQKVHRMWICGLGAGPCRNLRVGDVPEYEKSLADRVSGLSPPPAAAHWNIPPEPVEQDMPAPSPPGADARLGPAQHALPTHLAKTKLLSPQGGP